MKIKNSILNINVKDIDTTIHFYESIGFIIKNRWGQHYAQLDAPGISIGLHPTEEHLPNNNSRNVSIGFTVDDIEVEKKALQELNIHFTERKEEGGQFLHFNDPDGTALFIIKPKW